MMTRYEVISEDGSLKGTYHTIEAAAKHADRLDYDAARVYRCRYEKELVYISSKIERKVNKGVQDE
jgi:hypothetical protein